VANARLERNIIAHINVQDNKCFFIVIPFVDAKVRKNVIA